MVVRPRRDLGHVHLIRAVVNLVVAIARVVARRRFAPLVSRSICLATAEDVLLAQAAEHGGAFGKEGPECGQAGADDGGAEVGIEPDGVLGKVDLRRG